MHGVQRIEPLYSQSRPCVPAYADARTFTPVCHILLPIGQPSCGYFVEKDDLDLKDFTNKTDFIGFALLNFVNIKAHREGAL